MLAISAVYGWPWSIHSWSMAHGNLARDRGGRNVKAPRIGQALPVGGDRVPVGGWGRLVEPERFGIYGCVRRPQETYVDNQRVPKDFVRSSGYAFRADLAGLACTDFDIPEPQSDPNLVKVRL